MEIRYSGSTKLPPIWDGSKIDLESFAFLGSDDTARFLYTPEKIIRVTSNDENTEYAEGKDWIFKNGRFVRTADSSIPFIKEDELRNEKLGSGFKTILDGKEIPTLSTPDFADYQIKITYTHKEEKIFPSVTRSERLKGFTDKLKNGENVTVLFYGDSITYGCNSSYQRQINPYTPSWTLFVTFELAKKYGYSVKFVSPSHENCCPVPDDTFPFGSRGTITYANPSVGGWSSWGGVQNFADYVEPVVKEYGCDLFITAFGMNDDCTITPERIEGRQDALFELFDSLNCSPETIIVSPMLPNPDGVAPWKGNQDIMEDAYIAFSDKRTAAGKPTAVAPVTSFCRVINKKKKFIDITGNNVNHPNDFLSRIYTDVTLNTII